VLRALILAALAIGCGHLHIDPAAPGDADADADDAPGTPDAPTVPSAICKVHRLPVETTPAIADLAASPTSDGYVVIWVDTAGTVAAHAVLIGPDLGVLGSFPLPDLPDTALGGIADAGERLVLASATGKNETLRILGRDLKTATVQSTLTGHITGHDPYPSDAVQTPRAFLTGVGNQLVMSFVAIDGLVNPATTVFTTLSGGPIVDLACNDGPTNHAHCVWIEQLPSGGSQCTASDIILQVPNAPQMGSKSILSDDCHGIRNATGPVPADSMIITWTTAAGSVEARYIVSTGDVSRTISATGSAPKTVFDGTRFWVAWLDSAGGLRLSSFALNGTVADYSLAGWTPTGPESFELVRRGTEAALVLLSPGELDFLSICP
jgi:hypothetical protein